MERHLGDELAFLPATELVRRMRRREISPVDLVTVFLERIERMNPQIGAYVTITAERALAEAAAAERALMSGDLDQLGPLHGIPIAVKDLTPTAGVRTTFGSRAFEHFVPETDSPEIGRVFAAGAILLGKTNTPEFGLTMTTENDVFPPTRNPWDLSRIAGGSSGGSGAALAAYLCPLAQGTDAGGSIRIPAAACGVVGLKPSRGRIIPNPFSYAAIAGFATPGPMGRTVDDVALLLGPMTAPIAPRPMRLPDTSGPLRVGWTAKCEGTAVDPEVVATVERVATLLSEMGHEVEEDAPDLSNIYDPFLTIVAAFTAVNPWLDPTKVGMHARATFDVGKKLSATEYLQAEFAVLELHRRVLGWYRKFDILLCPTLPRTAPPLGALGGTEEEVRQKLGEFGAFTYWVNMTGQPAISLPLGESAERLPIGVQLVGKSGADDALLALAMQLEEAMPWAGRVPPIAVG